MQFQRINWFFANQRVYLFRGLHPGAFVTTDRIDGART
jgi:hypothetical protein